MGFSLAMPIFRNQGSRWLIYDADFLGTICLTDFLNFFFPLHLIKSKSSSKK